jgi:hypothetical protein
MTTVNVTRGDTIIVRIITAGPQGPASGEGGGAGTDLSYDAATRTIASSTGTDAVLPVATTALAGLESAADKTKLDSITVDSATLVRKYVRNNSGVTIPKGAAVYQTGSSGTTLTVALADASAEATAAQTLGLAQETIANNASGYIVAVGLLDGISTAALTEGQIIWLSETTGEVTSTRPTQPAHGVVCGYCVKQAAGAAGILYIKVDNGLELEELHDVLITAPATGQVLRRAADGLWKNAALDVSDVTGALSAATAATTYQPLDSDLTSIAALTTTSFGRSLLTQADAAAARTTIGAGTGNGTVTDVTATAPLTSSGGTAPVISTSMATNRLLGRSTAGTGVAEEIVIGSGLSLSAGTLTATSGGGSSFTGYAVGNYIIPTIGALGAGNAINANQIALMPFVVNRAVTINELAVRITTAAAGSFFQLAIYASTSGIHSGTPVCSTANISAGTTGPVSGSVTPVTLQPGVLYWQAINSDGAPVFISVAANNAYQSSIVGSSSISEVLTATGTTFHSRAISSQTFGTWPDLTGVASVIPTANQRRVPVFALLVSALP